MTSNKQVIWCDSRLERVSPELLQASKNEFEQYEFKQGSDNLKKARIAYGQPNPTDLKTAENLQWVHITSAGHSEYDGDDIRALFKERDIKLTNSSAVYAEPCAEHLMAMMLGLARCLPRSVKNQINAKDWNQREQRFDAYLLRNQKVLLLGFGAIARRLVELLQPFDMHISALRRHPSEEKNVTIISKDDLSKVLSEADHVVNILPDNDATKRFVDKRFLGQMKPGAVFYNIGRGTSVDQNALMAALHEGRLAAAYLDVTTPEPLPPDHPLWTTPNCHITPHSGGGHHNEFDRLFLHFLKNLKAFEVGGELSDRLM